MGTIYISNKTQGIHVLAVSEGIEVEHWLDMGKYYFSSEISLHHQFDDPLSANPTEWSNTLKQFVG